MYLVPCLDNNGTINTQSGVVNGFFLLLANKSNQIRERPSVAGRQSVSFKQSKTIQSKQQQWMLIFSKRSNFFLLLLSERAAEEMSNDDKYIHNVIHHS